VALSDQTDDTAVALEGHHVLGTALFHLGDCRGARAHLERAAGLYDLERHAGQLWMFGFDPGVSSRVYLALCFVQEGRPVEALRAANAARRMARRIAHPFSRCYALLVPGLIELQLGATASARPWIEKGLGLASQHAFPHWLAWSNVLLGRVRAELESPEAGIAQIREGLRIHRSIDSRVSIPTELGLLAEACLLTGRTEEGLAAIAEAFSQIDASEERWWSAELHRLKGELLMTPGHDLTEAERSLERAAAIARQQGTRFWEFRAALALCRLWLRQGRNAAARDRLEEICGWLGRDFDTPDRREAQALLRAEQARS
jgi:predicted ATPase